MGVIAAEVLHSYFGRHGGDTATHCDRAIGGVGRQPGLFYISRGNW